MQKPLRNNFIKEWTDKSGEYNSKRFFVKTYFRPKYDDTYDIMKGYDERVWETKLEKEFPKIILERYSAEEQAVRGHQRWMRIIKNNPEDKRIKDCRNSMEVFLLPPDSRDLILKEPKITKKGIYVYRKKPDETEFWIRTSINKKVKIIESIVDMKKAMELALEPSKTIGDGLEKESVDITVIEDEGTQIVDTILNPHTQIWETNICLGKEDIGNAERYFNQEDAIKGHKKWIHRVKENPKSIW